LHLNYHLAFELRYDQAEAAENNATQKQDDSSDASKVKGNVQTIEQSSATLVTSTCSGISDSFEFAEDCSIV
jgi:hypothetical protein